ncbi:transcription factor bHLH47 [Punica granatum]|uniref:Transcription factor bHLH47 n=1 Tax=Punica granatum TaxID=22663 RepID=A0A6P8EHY3_PUNGR|nr:transcription factor bHLH47 [Punica granatum]XP_031405123.1 transcription factor bHLH47 [Punica granatum]
MGSETTASSGEASGGRASPRKKNPAKIPKRIHKAEREKQKREHLNELFQDLVNALELAQPNNGKASILCEGTRFLKEIFGQIESLKKENVSLLSESHYVTVEKNELREENSALEAQIEKLEDELRARVAESKPDLNVPAPLECQPQPEYPGIEPTMQQPPAVLIVPVHPDLPSSYPMQASQVSKPHARYPTPADSWPSQLLLREQTNQRIELQLDDSGNHSSSNRERGSD